LPCPEFDLAQLKSRLCPPRSGGYLPWFSI
jgi:hypothetical protein